MTKPSGDLEFGVLGPLVVRRDGVEIALTRRRHRQLLARLLVDAGQVVGARRLIGDVWGTASPDTRTGPLRTAVWELRRLLGPARDAPSPLGDPDQGDGGANVLLTRGAGYVLAVTPGQVDSMRFEAAVASARAAAAAGRTGEAHDRLADALALWRGPAFDDLADDLVVAVEAERLDQVHLGARELRAELLLTLGRPGEVVEELTGLAHANPERERLWALLMTALYRTGRQAAALRCYQEARSILVDSVGIEPGPALRDLEQAILRHDPALDEPSPPDDRSPRPLRQDATHPQPPPHPDPPGGRGQAAAANPPPRPPGGLPRPRTSLVGRGRERVDVAQLLERSRLVTLAGAGGCGKTRLAMAVAADVAPRFPGGVGFVDLGAVAGGELVASALAAPFGTEVGETDPLGPLAHRIAGGEVLLVLDNCEHLLDAVAACIDELLARCPSLRILSTSREELRLAGEAVRRVPGLSLPSPLADGPYLGSEAVQLFVERGRAVLPGFAPAGEALHAVAAICRRLDGLPLAIELAAALAGSLPVADIAARLDDRFRLLSTGFRRAPARHQTLRATLDWSVELLDEDARALLARLSVLVGDFSLAAAEAVAGDGADRPGVARGLARLVRSSMLDVVVDATGAQRYRLLETVRAYARELLDELGDVAALHRRHARHYATLAADTAHRLRGPGASRVLAEVVAELPNLRAALRWAMAHDELELGLRLAGSLPWSFSRMALLDELAPWLDGGLRHHAELAPDLQLRALTAASTVALVRGELARVHQLSDAAVALARRLGDAPQVALALMLRGGAAVYGSDLARAESCFGEADELCRRLGDRWGRAWLLTGTALVTHRAGDQARARGQLEEALASFRRLDDPHGQVLPLVHLALLAADTGATGEALDRAGEAVRTALDIGAHDAQHVSLAVLGMVELLVGHADRARDLLLHSIRSYPRSANKVVLVVVLECLAVLAAAAGRHEHAVALLGYTGGVRRRWGIVPPPWRRRELDVWQDRARAALGADGVARETARGRRIGLDDAVRLAEVGVHAAGTAG